MAKSSSLAGAVKLRQVAARDGSPYAAVTIPRAVVDAWDLAPGEMLSYYLSEDGALVFRPLRHVLTGQTGFDPGILPKGEWKTPRPGSVAEAALKVEVEAEEMSRVVSRKSRDPRDYDPKVLATLRDPYGLRAERAERAQQTRARLEEAKTKRLATGKTKRQRDQEELGLNRKRSRHR